MSVTLVAPQPSAMLCRLILGDKLYAKVVLGMPNVALHAQATEGYDSSWCSNASTWPAPTSQTGEAVYYVSD